MMILLLCWNFEKESLSLSSGAAKSPATVSNGGWFGAEGCALEFGSVSFLFAPQTNAYRLGTNHLVRWKLFSVLTLSSCDTDSLE